MLYVKVQGIQSTVSTADHIVRITHTSWLLSTVSASDHIVSFTNTALVQQVKC